MLALKTPLAFIISIIIAVIAYFVSASLTDSSIVLYLPSIISVLTVVVLIVVSSAIHSNAQVTSTKSNPAPSQKSSTASSGELTTLYIGNLAYKANEKLVEEYFTTIGKVISVRLVKDKKTGRRKGFGFVEIDSSDEDLFIKKLNESEFMERNIIVRPANEKKH